MLRKKVENEIFHIAALYGANIYQIFFTRFVIEKYLESAGLQLILVDLLA